jgi:4-diphosphocytidyl-2-C-methyl-D-erythritol kinase
LALERVVKKCLDAEKRLRIAAEVGSDVPLFLLGGTVLGVGRGEQVFPVEDLPSTHCVVVTPEVGVSTPKAFAEWDRRVAESLQGLESSSSQETNAALKRRSSTADDGAVENAGLRPAWTGKSSRPHTGSAGLRPAEQPKAAVPTRAEAKLTVQNSSDRMSELGRGFGPWLSESYSGAPFRRGRAENPLLALVRAGIKNDFEEVVFPEYPELSEGKNALERAGAKYASLSGSGSTLYGLFASKEAASAAVAKLRRLGWAAQATVTLTRREYWRRIFAG